jgi:hypothetical protein
MKVLAFSFMLLVALVTVSCGGGPSSQDSPTAQIRIMQASGDLGNVDVHFNGNTVANNLGWRQTFPTKATSYISVQAGTVHYQEFATGTASPALVDTLLALSSNTFYTVITAGEQSSASVATILLTDDHVVPAPGQLRLRFVNAASAAGPIDLYFVSGSNAGLPSTPSVPALAYNFLQRLLLIHCRARTTLRERTRRRSANPRWAAWAPWSWRRFLHDVGHAAVSIATPNQSDLCVPGSIHSAQCTSRHL